ncbi:hypothetical protein KASIA_p090 [Shewanella phage vB_SspS_KASIA]|nr:hypothetical protein KASIA_p090 [Shewanella phage vB_SspS_KASIA]
MVTDYPLEIIVANADSPILDVSSNQLLKLMGGTLFLIYLRYGGFMAEEVSTPRRSRRGFAGIDPEIAEQSRLKSLETRKANAEMRNNRLEAAKKLRDQVTELKKEIEILEQKADELDGEITANKNRRKYEAQLTADLEELIGGVVSPQYLKQTIAHAIRTGLSADQVITPIQAAMDILHDPDVTRKERLDAIKLLSAFESSKPIAKEVDMGDTLGSVQDELNKLKAKHGDLAPKRKQV